MKRLELDQMENLEGGMDWKNFADGACIASFLFINPVITGACAVYSLGRVTDTWY